MVTENLRWVSWDPSVNSDLLTGIGHPRFTGEEDGTVYLCFAKQTPSDYVAYSNIS